MVATVIGVMKNFIRNEQHLSTDKQTLPETMSFPKVILPTKNFTDIMSIVNVLLNGVLSELRVKYNGVCMELQGSRLGFNVCVVPSSVKLSVLEFMEVGVGSELDRS